MVKLVRFLLLFVAILSPFAHSLVIYSPNQSIKASEINSNFNEIKNIFQTRGFPLNFNNYVQGSVIRHEDLETDFDKIRDLDFQIPYLSHDTIKSSELNSSFSAALSEASNSNDIPQAFTYTETTPEDVPLIDSLSYVDVYATNRTFSILSQPSVGVLTLTNASSGSYSYQAPQYYNGSVFFTYQLSDGEKISNIGTVTINISSVNNPMSVIPSPSSINTIVNVAQSGNITASDPDGFVMSVASFPNKGVLSFNALSGDYTYTPNLNQYGTDSFSINITDNEFDNQTLVIPIQIATTRSCPMANGTGVETFNTSTNIWESCLVASCNSAAGYYPSSGNIMCVLVEATGGMITTSGDYKTHILTASETMTFTNISSQPVEYLLIGGGGGGANGSSAARGGGGGGAGGHLTGTVSISGGIYPVVVGAGGINGSPATKGGDSSFNSLVAFGGGRGGGAYESSAATFDTAGTMNGASSGGGGGSNAGIYVGQPGTRILGQGNLGGTGGARDGNFAGQGGGGGGGGGASSVGIGGTNGGGGGSGGSGISYSLSGSPVTYCRGGNGGSNTGTETGSSAAANTGNGGGGGGGRAGTPTPGGLGGSGGSGIVIIKYKYK